MAEERAEEMEGWTCTGKPSKRRGVCGWDLEGYSIYIMPLIQTHSTIDFVNFIFKNFSFCVPLPVAQFPVSIKALSQSKQQKRHFSTHQRSNAKMDITTWINNNKKTPANLVQAGTMLVHQQS